MRRISLQYIIPAVLALVITIGLGFFFPSLTTEYKIELIGSESVAPEYYTYYCDLNGDGESEILTISYNASDNLAVSVASLKMATINQFNLPGRLTELGRTLDFHDIDSNGITDLFLCTEKDDSLFLTLIDNLYGHPTTTREVFLDPINQLNDYGDYLFVPGSISDLNGDGSPEYVMAINGGHSLQPRRVYAIDFNRDTVLKSPISGAAVISLDLFDLDRDGLDEILLNTVAPENFKSPIPYRDSVSWLMVLDNHLDFYAPPLATVGLPSWVSLEPFIYEGEHYFMSYHRYRKDGDYEAAMAIYDEAFSLIRSRIFGGHQHSGHHMYRVKESYNLEDIKILYGSSIVTFDFDLQQTDSLSNDNNFGYNAEVRLDADGDGEKEFVFLGADKLHIFRSDFTESASLEVNNETKNPSTDISLIEHGDAYPQIHLQMEGKQMTFLYVKNDWFRFRSLIYPVMYLVLFGFFYLWVVLQNRMVAKRFEKDRLINQLQLQSIKSQLDPHFTYNALNAVGSLIYKGEKDLAYEYLRGLTDLLRLVSSDSSQVTWSILEELEFVNRYLEIEKLRFREKFIYQVTVQEEHLNGYEVPKMSVLTFVENAIKHGLRHKDYDRKLGVEVVSFKKGLKIFIRDNGIGRAASAKHQEESEGQGIKMMKKYFKQFNEVTGKKARFVLKDLFEYDLKASGTVIEITII